MGELLREASEALATACDKLDAAQLAEQGRNEKIRESFKAVVESIGQLSDLLRNELGIR
jgi:hypothetical protein